MCQVKFVLFTFYLKYCNAQPTTLPFAAEKIEYFFLLARLCKTPEDFHFLKSAENRMSKFLLKRKIIFQKYFYLKSKEIFRSVQKQHRNIKRSLKNNEKFHEYREYKRLVSRQSF